MIGELLDRAVSIVSPASAARRAHARGLYQQISKRSYDAAKLDRLHDSWKPVAQSADQALLGRAEVVRDRARDLVRNNAYARGAVDALVSNVVGCGIQPRPALEDEPTNQAILDAWNRWAEEADAGGRLHLYELQALVLREMAVAGEVIQHFANDRRDRARSLPLVVESIEAERIDTSRDTYSRYTRRPEGLAEGNEIRRGIEIDQFGKARAYWLHDRERGYIGYATPESKRYAAGETLHLFQCDRAGQTRGSSWFAPVLLWFRNLGLYMDNELQSSAVAACFTAVIKTVDSGDSFGALATPSGAESTDTDSNRFERIQPGLVTHLMPGEDISVINPARQSGSAEPWIALLLRSIATGFGLSYELISRDYSKSNFSSTRAASLEDRRRFRSVQKYLVWHLCQPIYREFFLSSVLAGKDGFPSREEFVADPLAWLAVTWRAPGWEWVDPLKEAQAAALEIKEGLRSRGDVIESGGGDLRETFEELAAEQALAEELGLTLGAVAETQAITEITAKAQGEANAESEGDDAPAESVAA